MATSLFDAWFKRFSEHQPLILSYLHEFITESASSNPHLLKFETEGTTVKAEPVNTAANDDDGDDVSDGSALDDAAVDEKSRKGRTWRAPSTIKDSAFAYELPKSLSSRARAQGRRKSSSSGGGGGGGDTPGSRWEREVGMEDAEEAVVEQCEQLQDAGGLITQQLVRQLMTVRHTDSYQSAASFCSSSLPFVFVHLFLL